VDVSIAYIPERGRRRALGQALVGVLVVFLGLLTAGPALIGAIFPLLLAAIWPRWAHKLVGEALTLVLTGLGVLGAVIPGAPPGWHERRRADPDLDKNLRAQSPWRGETLVMGWPEASPIQLRIPYRRRRWQFHLVIPILLLCFVGWVPLAVAGTPYLVLALAGLAVVLITGRYPRRLFVPSAFLLAWFARYMAYLWLATPALPLSAAYSAEPIRADLTVAVPSREPEPIAPPASPVDVEATGDGRLRCGNCGHENAPTRQACKRCRAELPRERLVT
jgi:hypothetical protein